MGVERVAIVGLGSIGRRHLRLLKELRPTLEVILVRSGRGGRQPEGEALATAVISTVEEAIAAGVQAAIIATPASMHLRQALRFAEAGVHFLVEKPLSLSHDGLEALLDIAARKQVKGLVGYVLRYDPAAQCFAERLRAPDIGRILHAGIVCGSFLPEWRPQQDYRSTVSASWELGGGVLLELSHELDYAHWFFGVPAEVQARLAKSGSLDIDVEDQANLLLSCAGGVQLSVHLDFNRRIPARTCVVQTTEGELCWDAVGKEVTWRPAGEAPQTERFDHDRDYIYRRQLEHFLACVEEDAIPAVGLADGAAVMRLVDAARQADATGRRVALA